MTPPPHHFCMLYALFVATSFTTLDQASHKPQQPKSYRPNQSTRSDAPPAGTTSLRLPQLIKRRQLHPDLLTHLHSKLVRILLIHSTRTARFDTVRCIRLEGRAIT